MTKQPARIQVRETKSIDSYSFDGKLESIIDRLETGFIAIYMLGKI